MRAAPHVERAIEELGWPVTKFEGKDREGVFKILVDLYDRGFEDGADYVEQKAKPARCAACREEVEHGLEHFVKDAQGKSGWVCMGVRSCR